MEAIVARCRRHSCLKLGCVLRLATTTYSTSRSLHSTPYASWSFLSAMFANKSVNPEHKERPTRAARGVCPQSQTATSAWGVSVGVGVGVRE